MKRTITLLLAAVFLFSIAGCTFQTKEREPELHEGALDSEFTALKLDVDVAQITVTPGDGFRVEYGLCNEPEIGTADDGTLTIREKAADHWWDGIHFTQNIQPYVKVTVPAGTVLSTVDVTVDVGDVEISMLELGSLHVDADVGDLTLQSLTVQGAVDLSADVGNLDCREMVVIGAVQMEVDTGDIAFDGSAARIDADTDVGNVKLLLPGTAADWAMELETDVGDITVDGIHQGDRYETRGGQYQLEAESDTGDVEVAFQ